MISIHAKSAVYGLDKIIKQVQVELSNSLTWLGSVEIYGKIQPTEKDSLTIPEAYTDSGEYNQIFIDDRVSAVVGFELITRRIESNKKFANVDVIFTVNLESIFGNKRRDDERAIEDAFNALNKSSFVVSINEIKEGIANVFSNFSNESIKHRDMQPLFVFSINCDLLPYYDDFAGCSSLN